MADVPEDGTHAAESARPIGETYDSKSIENVKINLWQVKPTNDVGRVLCPKSYRRSLLWSCPLQQQEKKISYKMR